jgi:hypothetical protein
MSQETAPQTHTEANSDTLGDMLTHYSGFSELDLEGLLQQFEAGESNEV